MVNLKIQMKIKMEKFKILTEFIKDVSSETKDIQTYLSNNGFNPGIIDGKIGSYTREAIKAFQRKVGLIPDGVVGNRTKAEMRSYTGC